MEEHQGPLRICPKVSRPELGARVLAIGADHVLETTGSFPQSSSDCTTVTQPWELLGSVCWVSSHSSQESEGPGLLPELPKWLIQVSDPIPPASGRTPKLWEPFCNHLPVHTSPWYSKIMEPFLIGGAVVGGDLAMTWMGRDSDQSQGVS